MPSGAEIREMFLRFFESKGHKRVHSSSLVPANDPTLLFTNAGMNQFKDVFLGLEKRDYARATTSQKCVRAGGKHNDLENVGFTNRHHTFFEMLGNFSFGDYFKKDAISYAWELVTSEKWFGIAKEKLYATIFKGEQGIPRDDEAAEHWLAQGVPKERIFDMGMKDNFWAMGDTGPCGPCSEIHYDMGAEASDQGHTDCHFPCDCGRYVEIWNLVFMQFDRDASGKLNPLPKPCVDTGAGLERVTAVLQGVISNYETDLFTPLIKRAAELLGIRRIPLAEFPSAPGRAGARISLRVIADHARAVTFLISDGVLPSNEGRGYVLRKIIRRAIRHAWLLGHEQPFLYQTVFAVCNQMKDAYPELVESADRVANVVKGEETRFARTLSLGLTRLNSDLATEFEEYLEKSAAVETGMQKLKDELSALKGEERSRRALAMLEGLGVESRRIRYKGENAFKLYDTFGLPLDFIQETCRDVGIEFDQEGFDRAMAEQRERARASWKGASKRSADPALAKFEETQVVRDTRADRVRVLAVDRTPSGGEVKPGSIYNVILDRTPFYAESGGQIGDVGWLYEPGTNVPVAEVLGTAFAVLKVRSHRVRIHRDIRVNDVLDAEINWETRLETMRNHTATHLLHAALRETLGKHVKQAGSLVDPKHLRFDFSHFTGVADEELQDIEDLANREVLRNQRVELFEDVPIDVAVNEFKAMALFGEKYGDRVRVIKIGDFSTELCGGTHTGATGEIGLIKVLSEGSVSSGVRRLEAVTGEGSLQHFRKDHELERAVATLTSRREASVSPAEAVKLELASKDEEIKRLRRELDQVRMKSAASTVSSAEEKVRTVNGIKVLAQRVDNLERTQMRTLVDNMRNKLGSGVAVLGSVTEVDGEKKVALIVGVTKDLTQRLQAGKVIAPIAQKVGGSGGGRPDMAEAGGKDAAQLDAALESAYGVVEGLAK